MVTDQYHCFYSFKNCDQSPTPSKHRDTELEFLAIIPAIYIMRDTRVENL